MSRPEDVFIGAEDEYIDDLIRMVYKQDRLREIREITEKSEEPLTPEREEMAARLRERMRAELKEAERQKTKEKRKAKILRLLPRIAEIAACLILVAAIGTTIAIAKNESFRSSILELLIHIDEEEGVANISFEENTREAFDVPADWPGDYYPSRIPDDFTMTYIYTEPEMPGVEYRSADGRIIRFDENTFNTISTQGIEEVDVKEITINDRPALMVTDENPDDLFNRITWSNDEKWFVLETVYMTKEETIDLVKSVRKIIPKDEKSK